MASARKPWLIAVAGAGALAICATAALLPGGFREQLGLATRLTARWSAFWFLAAFTARPLSQLFGGIWRDVLRQRRYIGLGFALAHSIHGICFTWLLLATDVTRPPIVLVGGGVAYLLMWAMAATSSDAAMRALGRNWRWLHMTGMWWLWFVFTTSYAGRIERPESFILGVVMTTLFVSAALLRLPAALRRLHHRLT